MPLLWISFLLLLSQATSGTVSVPGVTPSSATFDVDPYSCFLQRVTSDIGAIILDINPNVTTCTPLSGFTNAATGVFIYTQSNNLLVPPIKSADVIGSYPFFNVYTQNKLLLSDTSMTLQLSFQLSTSLWNTRLNLWEFRNDNSIDQLIIYLEHTPLDGLHVYVVHYRLHADQYVHSYSDCGQFVELIDNPREFVSESDRSEDVYFLSVSIHRGIPINDMKDVNVDYNVYIGRQNLNQLMKCHHTELESNIVPNTILELKSNMTFLSPTYHMSLLNMVVNNTVQLYRISLVNTILTYSEIYRRWKQSVRNETVPAVKDAFVSVALSVEFPAVISPLVFPLFQSSQLMITVLPKMGWLMDTQPIVSVPYVTTNISGLSFHLDIHSENARDDWADYLCSKQNGHRDVIGFKSSDDTGRVSVHSANLYLCIDLLPPPNLWVLDLFMSPMMTYAYSVASLLFNHIQCEHVSPDTIYWNDTEKIMRLEYSPVTIVSIACQIDSKYPITINAQLPLLPMVYLKPIHIVSYSEYMVTFSMEGVSKQYIAALPTMGEVYDVVTKTPCALYDQLNQSSVLLYIPDKHPNRLQYVEQTDRMEIYGERVAKTGDVIVTRFVQPLILLPLPILWGGMSYRNRIFWIDTYVQNSFSIQIQDRNVDDSLPPFYVVMKTSIGTLGCHLSVLQKSHAKVTVCSAGVELGDCRRIEFIVDLPDLVDIFQNLFLIVKSESKRLENEYVRIYVYHYHSGLSNGTIENELIETLDIPVQIRNQEKLKDNKEFQRYMSIFLFIVFCVELGVLVKLYTGRCGLCETREVQRVEKKKNW